MSEAEQPKRRATDNRGDLETRVSVLETRQEFVIETMDRIAKSLEKHINDEEQTMKSFTTIIAEMNKTVIINTEALRHLAATFVTHTAASEKITTQINDLDKRIDKHDIEVAKMETMGWTITKIAGVVSIIIGAIWAVASKFIGN